MINNNNIYNDINRWSVVAAGIPVGALAGRRHRFRTGHTSDIEDPRGVPRPDNEHVLCDAISEGVRHGRGAVQRDAVRAPAGGEH